MHVLSELIKRDPVYLVKDDAFLNEKKSPLHIIAINHCCVFQCCDPNWYNIPNWPTGYATGSGTWCKRKSWTRRHRLRLGRQVSKGLLVIVYKSSILFYYFCHLRDAFWVNFYWPFLDIAGISTGLTLPKETSRSPLKTELTSRRSCHQQEEDENPHH